MSAAVATKTTSRVDPVVGFSARCEARAHLYGAGEIDLHEAVDVLQGDAERDGLVGSIGPDVVQAIIAEAFRPVRDREWSCVRPAAADEAPPVAEDEGPPLAEPVRTGTPASTVEALMYGFRRGLSCLADDPRNRDRLRRCDTGAMKEIAAQLLDMKVRSNGARPNWSKEAVAKLLSIWKAER